MKTIKAFVSVSVLLLSLSGLAQDMSPGKPQKNTIPSKLKKVLFEDKTDEHAFITGQYYCHNFASQFFLQNSSVVKDLSAFDLPAMESEWGTIINRSDLTEKLPIYYVSLGNEENGFYHAINAYLLNPNNPEKLESYLLIEPQTDEVFFTVKDIYDRYRKYYDKSDAEEVLKVSIGTFDAFKNNGFIYQSFTNSLYKFEVKFK